MSASLTGLGDFLVGSFLGAVGVLALLLAFMRHRKADPLLAAFGGFSLLYGVRLVFRSEITASAGVGELERAWVANTITYAINIPAWAFFWQLLGRGWRSLVVWWLGVVCVFAVVGVSSDLYRQTPGTLAGHPNNVLVLIGSVVAALAFFASRQRLTLDLKILLVGLSTFFLFAINDNLVSMRLLPWSWHEESIGFVILVACLGSIAARNFFRREGQLAALEIELDTAREIQRSLLPRRLPGRGGLEVALRFQPTSAVGGDLYDFVDTDQGAVGVLVADVSGHGVPAALITSMVKVALVSHRDCADYPAELLTRMNRTLCGSMQRGFVTAAYVLIDSQGGSIVAASAGHPRPLLARAAGREVLEIGGQGPILGRFATPSYVEERLPLCTGDRLVLFTDGLVEAQRRDGEQWGEAALSAFVNEGRAQRPEGFCDALLQEVGRWTGQSRSLDLRDDLTLLVVDVA